MFLLDVGSASLLDFAVDWTFGNDSGTEGLIGRPCWLAVGTSAFSSAFVFAFVRGCP